jgi:predicted amidohydrolase YtcJ
MNNFFVLRFWDSVGPFAPPCVQMVSARLSATDLNPWVEIDAIQETMSVWSLEEFAKEFSTKECFFLVSGFVDSHLHLLGLGKKDSELDLSKFQSAQEIFHALKKYLNENPQATKIVGYGWDESKLKIRTEELILLFEKHAPEEVPVFLKRHCRHSALANKSMRKRAGHLELPSWIHDEHLGIFLESLDKPEVVDSEKLLIRAQNILLKRGIVGVGDMSQDEHSSFVISKMFAEGKFQIDVAGVVDWGRTPSFENSGPGRFVSKVSSPFLGRPPGYGVYWGKKYLDGSLGSSSAHLTKTYSDQSRNFGKKYFETPALLNVCREVLQREFCLSFHAIGDAAVDQIIEVNEKLKPLIESRTKDFLHRVEHAQVLRDDQIEYFGKNPYWSFHFQPIHRQTDLGFSEARLGSSRLFKEGYRANTIVRKNIPTCLGSDAPIDLEDPLMAIRALISHPNIEERMSIVRGLWHSTLHPMSILGFSPPKLSAGSRALVVGVHEADKILSFRESEFC